MNNNFYKGRKLFIFLIFAASILAILIQSISYQYTNKDFYVDKSNARQIKEYPILTSRGMILDRNNYPLAITIPEDSIVATEPKILLENNKAFLDALDILGLDRDDVNKKLRKNINKKFIYIKRHIRTEISEKIKELKVEGLYFKKENKRYYTEGEVIFPLIGQTTIDDIGVSGLEKSYNEILSGKNGEKRVLIDNDKNIVKDLELIKSPIAGKDIKLTIDHRLQYLAYKELKKQIENVNASSGSVVIIDSENGEILSIANYPSFNPNYDKRSSEKINKARNRAVIDLIEPASTIKPFLAVAALSSKKVSLSDKFDTSGGKYQFTPDLLVRDESDYGILTMSGIIKNSSSVGSVKIIEKIDNKDYYNILKYVGFGERINLNFPGVSKGKLQHYKEWKKVRSGTLSYGYGVSVTPLQLVSAYNVIANHGKKIAPKLILRNYSNNNKNIPKNYKDSFSKVKRMMRRVVTEGTAKRANFTGYSVAGKTGTAKKIKTYGKGYSSDKYTSIFVGMTPANNTKLIISVVIDNPRVGGFFGGTIAAPVFRNIARESLRILNINADIKESLSLNNYLLKKQEVPHVF